MYIYWTLIVLLFSGFLNLVYSASAKDSLKHVLHSTPEDTAKVNLYHTLSLEITAEEPDSAMFYAEQSIELAKKLNYIKGEARGNYTKGKILLSQSRYKDCIKYVMQALGISEKVKDDDKFKGDAHLVLGRAYDYTGDYFNSLVHFQKGVELYRKIDYLKGIANSFVNIGIIHNRLKDYVKALEYYRKAETKYVVLKDSIGLVYLYNNIGFLDYEQQNYSNAKENYLKGIELSKDINFENLLPFLYNNLGTLHSDLKETSEAEAIFLKANEISRKVNDRDGVVNSLMALAGINYKERDFDKYLEEILWSYKESKQQGNKSLIKETSELLSDMYEFNGDKTKALHYLNVAYEMQDSLNSKSLIEETSRLEIQYYLEQRKRQEQLEIESRDKQIKYGSLILLSLCGLLIGFLFLKNRQNKAKDILNNELMKKNALLFDAEQNLELRNHELEKYIESNIQLEQFAYFASHDLKTPLRTIASFTGLLKKNLKENYDKKTESYIQAIERGTRRMNALVVDLLDHAKVNSQVLTLEKFSFKEMFEEVEQNLKYAINHNKINLIFKNEHIEIEADRAKIKQVLENLVSNAIKFSSNVKQPQVEITVQEDPSNYIISVNDHGIGIDKKYHDNIFKSFIQLHAKSEYEGTGLGLAICKNIVEKHGGKIWVKSKKGHGTCMQFSLPKNPGFVD